MTYWYPTGTSILQVALIGKEYMYRIYTIIHTFLCYGT